MKTKMLYPKARKIAEHYRALLAPSCERIEIAGSIRRKATLVGDIEIVAIPKIVPVKNLFGEIIRGQNHLNLAIGIYLSHFGARVIKNGNRYKQIALLEGVNLDLFIVQPPAQWGVIFALRTGPNDFSKWIVTQRYKGGALPNDCYVRDGAVWRDGTIIPMPEENDFLQLLNLPVNLPPERR